jgi:hypothetical protein
MLVIALHDAIANPITEVIGFFWRAVEDPSGKISFIYIGV